MAKNKGSSQQGTKLSVPVLWLKSNSTLILLVSTFNVDTKKRSVLLEIINTTRQYYRRDSDINRPVVNYRLQGNLHVIDNVCNMDTSLRPVKAIFHQAMSLFCIGNLA